MKRILLAISLLAISISETVAKPSCRLKTYTTENGLPASIVSKLTQTPDNLMWITSWNGLSCFDGYRFTIFSNAPGNSMMLSTNHLQNSNAGHDNNIWVETYTGDVYLFDTHKCCYLNVSKMLTGKETFRLRKVYSLENGVTWLVGKDDIHYRIVGHPEKGDITEHHFLGKMKKAFCDSIAFKVMPKLRGVEVRGQNEEKFEQIGNILATNAEELIPDYNHARELTTELFQWCSADFMNKDDE